MPRNPAKLTQKHRKTPLKEPVPLLFAEDQSVSLPGSAIQSMATAPFGFQQLRIALVV